MSPADFVKKWRSLRIRTNLYCSAIAAPLLIGAIYFFGELDPWDWPGVSLGLLCLLFLAFIVLMGGGLLPAGLVLWWSFKAPREGLFSSDGREWSVNASNEGIRIRRDGVETEVAWDSLGRAEWVWWDEWDQVRGIEDVVWLHLTDSTIVPVPESADGFHGFRARVAKAVPFTSRGVEL